MQPRQAAFFAAVPKSGSMLPDDEAARHIARKYLGFVGAGAKHSALFCWLYVDRLTLTTVTDDK